MDKKGIGRDAIVIILITVASFLAIFVIIVPWLIEVKEEKVPAIGCRMDFIEAKSKLASKLVSGWPELSNCKRVTVEIEAKDENEIIKELSEYMFEAAKDIGRGNLYSFIEGRYCKKKFHPITFKTKNLKISKIKFNSYLTKNKPIDVKFEIDSQDKPIDTEEEYTVLFLADFGESILDEVKRIYTPEFLEKRIASKSEGIYFIESDKISELYCSYLA